MAPAMCGTDYATHRVTQRTTDTNDRPDWWVRTTDFSPPVVLCIVEE